MVRIGVGSRAIFKAPGLGGLKPWLGNEGGERAGGGCGSPLPWARGGGRRGWAGGGVYQLHTASLKNPARAGPSSALVLLAPLPGGKVSQVWGKWVE